MIIALSFVSCHSNRDKIMIQGDIEHNIYKKIYLSKTTSEGTCLIDSTEIHQGHFLFKIKTNETGIYPAFYQLSLSPVNNMNTIAKCGDRLQITADANNLVKTYTIEGSDDAKRMLQLDRMLSAFVDTLDFLYTFYEQHIENDDMRAYVDEQYRKLLSRYNADLIWFIKQNSTSMVSIPAFYQTYNRKRFLDEQENIDLLQRIYHDLKEQYPDCENVKFLEQRVRKITSSS
jgi:hypothetical protein